MTLYCPLRTEVPGKASEHGQTRCLARAGASPVTCSWRGTHCPLDSWPGQHGPQVAPGSARGRFGEPSWADDVAAVGRPEAPQGMVRIAGTRPPAKRGTATAQTPVQAPLPPLSPASPGHAPPLPAEPPAHPACPSGTLPAQASKGPRPQVTGEEHPGLAATPPWCFRWVAWGGARGDVGRGWG